MFIYTEKYTESHRNTLDINVYNKTDQKHQKSQITFSDFAILLCLKKKTKIRHSKKVRFMRICMAPFIFICF